jgi:hypothetical protein
MELVVAMVASAFLMAGLASVMLIGRQVAYTPTAAIRRAKTSDVVSQISDELRYATLVIQQTPQILEFVVADRNADGTSEKIRYEWSGVANAPLRKTVNGGSSVDVLTSVNAFAVTLEQKAKTTTLTTTIDSAETILQSNTGTDNTFDRDIDASNWMSQIIIPSVFSAIPANAVSWNATKIGFYGRKSSSDSETLIVQLRPTGDPYDAPTSNVLGQVSIPESSLNDGWNTVTFASPIRDLTFSRRYQAVFMETMTGGAAARMYYLDTAPSGEFETTDAGASWTYKTTRQMFYRIYGTYTTPGTSYNVTRNYVSQVRLAVQSGTLSSSRVDASVPLQNLPELLATYWRTDFDRNPAATDANSDTVADWAVTGGGNFDTTKLINGIWYAAGAIETRPLSDFTTTTSVEVRCRNTGTGGYGALMSICVDRQSGQYAPLLVYVQRQSDGTQNLTLSGKTSDAALQTLCARTKLGSGFVRYRLTILPQNNLVNLQINGEDQGTFTYPTYAPTITTDRYLTVLAHTSSAEFDYVELRAATN